MKNSYSQILEYFADQPGVEQGRMFGSNGLKVNGKVFAIEVKKKLVVKLPSQRVNDLIKYDGVAMFDPGNGRKMKEWIEVDPAASLNWADLARESFRYVGRPGRTSKGN